MSDSVGASTRAGLVVLALAALLLPLLPPTPANASQSATTLEVELANRLNAERRQHGLAPVRVDVRLVASSRTWSQTMLRNGRLEHDPHLAGGVPGSVTAYGETVAYVSNSGDVAARIHSGFMNSAPHRSILLARQYTELGVGVALGSHRVYATYRVTAGAPARVSPALADAAALARELFGGGRAGHAVIARDDVYPDALAAGPLAGAGGPIVLTPPGPALHPEARLALEHALPKGRTVWIVGGTAAVSSDVERELVQAGWAVRRVFGRDRVETAEQVARTIAGRDGRPRQTMVATAADWPDAAAGGAFGAGSGTPILLSERDRVSPSTAAALRDLRPGATAALGGSAVLSDRVVRDLGAHRVYGRTRQGTSAAIAAELWGHTDASPRMWIAVPAFGDHAWGWALTAAPLAARHDAAVLLVGDELSEGMRSYVRSLGYGNGRSAQLRTYGPVSEASQRELRALLGQ